MRTIIHNLRQRPEHHRKGIALAVSAGFTLMLIAAWGITLPVRLASITAQSTAQPAAAIAASPLDSLRTSLNKNTSDVGAELQAQSGSATDIYKSQSTNYVSNGVVISDANASSSSSSVSPFMGQ